MMDAPDKETLRTDEQEQPDGSPLALYVMTPRGGTRYLLRPGQLAYVGRSLDATIRVNDPGVSRLHALINLAEPPTISDLGSSNGTFLGGERLTPRQAREIVCNEVFLVGSCAMVLRPSGLPPVAAQRFIAIDDLPRLRTGGETASGSAPQGWIILRAHAAKSADLVLIEAILAELLFSPADWLMRITDRDVAIGVAGASGADIVALERAALARLASWGLAGEIEGAFVGDLATPGAVDAALAFLNGNAVVTTRDRGLVVLRGPAMQAIYQTLKKVAPARVSMLILGETGVGKDLVASVVHEMSPRAARPFVRLNCASLPEHLIESQLFGHERGAFTGAISAATGLLEAADGGTIFLDEIGELAPALQPKLLRAIESSEIVRVGGVKPRPIDVRFLAATNRDLAADVEAGRFRRDLFHRLNCVTVTVPPLRERREEIDPLARRFLASACARFDLAPAQLSDASLAALEAHAWPGNVRELRNVIERAALVATGPSIEPSDLHLSPAPDAGDSATTNELPTTRARLALGERERIEEALLRCGGNQSRAAKVLGIPRRTLVRRISKLGLTRPRKSTPPL